MAIVGLGRIGQRYLDLIEAHPNFTLVAVCDKDKHRKNSAKDYPFFDSIDELLNATSGKLDVVCICTPNGLHASQTLKALDAGAHVVCEKPMALTRTDAEAMIYKSLQVSRHLFCVMQNRYSPPAVWLKKVVTDKIIGDIFMVTITCLWNRDERYYLANSWHGTAEMDGGVLFTQFSHFIDLMYWIFGDIRDIQHIASNFTHRILTALPEDTASVQFKFVNGGIGNIVYSTAVWDKNFESSLIVIGSKGTVKLGGQYMEKVEYCHIKDYELPQLLPTNPPNFYEGYQGSAANHGAVLQNVADVLQNKAAIATNAMEGLKVVDIIERIYKS